MDVFMVILRLVHIFSGVMWVGGSFMMTGFVGPSAQALGPDSQKFMQQLTLRSRFTPVMATVAVLTALSGLTMYWRLFRGLAPLNSGTGLALTLGGLAGLVGLAVGYIYQNRGAQRLKTIAAEIAASGGPPQPEQLAEIQAVQERVAKSGVALTLILVVALIGMTLSEYFAL